MKRKSNMSCSGKKIFWGDVGRREWKWKMKDERLAAWAEGLISRDLKKMTVVTG